MPDIENPEPTPSVFKKPTFGFKNRKRKGQARTTVVEDKKEEEPLENDVPKLDKYGMRELSKIEHLKSVHKKRRRNGGINAQGMSAEELKKQEDAEKYKQQAWKKQGGLMSADNAMAFLDPEAEVKMRHLKSTR